MSIYKNRFERNTAFSFAKCIALLPLLAFVLLFIMFINGIHSVSDTALLKQQENLETALMRSISQCYAVEGAYPPNLDYIVEHYGLTYDDSLFYIDYQPIGSNIMPDVTILSKSGGGK